MSVLNNYGDKEQHFSFLRMIFRCDINTRKWEDCRQSQNSSYNKLKFIQLQVSAHI